MLVAVDGCEDVLGAEHTTPIQPGFGVMLGVPVDVFERGGLGEEEESGGYSDWFVACWVLVEGRREGGEMGNTIAVFSGPTKEDLGLVPKECNPRQRERGYRGIPWAGELGERVEVEVVDEAEGEGRYEDQADLGEEGGDIHGVSALEEQSLGRYQSERKMKVCRRSGETSKRHTCLLIVPQRTTNI